MCGCGTTKWSDTSRTGTEQLLISNAIDRVVTKIDFSPMWNKKCYLNTTAIQQTTDRHYLEATIRQHLAAEGAILSVTEADADYIVEVRAGAVATDRDDLLLVGVPAMTLPNLPGATYSISAIPELPFIKRTKQRGVAKIALFAYNKETGKPVWVSGNSQGESDAQSLWIAGAGPITRGTIYKRAMFAGNPLMWLKPHSATDSVVGGPQVFSEAPPPSLVTSPPPSVYAPAPVQIPPPINPFPLEMR